MLRLMLNGKQTSFFIETFIFLLTLKQNLSNIFYQILNKKSQKNTNMTMFGVASITWKSKACGGLNLFFNLSSYDYLQIISIR